MTSLNGAVTNSNSWCLLPDELTTESILRFTPDSAPVLRLVSRELRRLGEVFLRDCATEILSASNDPASSLHFFTLQSFVDHHIRFYSQTGSNDLEFLRSIPRMIRDFGVSQEECPDRILLPGKVEEFNQRIMNGNLLKVWDSIYPEMREADPEPEQIPECTGAPSAERADRCRNWMRARPQVLSRVRKLDLFGKELTGVPMEMALFTGLHILELQCNMLLSLPPGLFSGLPGLLYLNLEGAELCSLPPHVFDGQSELQTLELGQNRLSALAPDLFHGMLRLQKLGLGNNQLVALSPNQFHGLGRLRLLGLNNNELGALSPNQFEGLSVLEHLALHGNRIDILLPGLFDGLTLLERLELNGNRLRVLSHDQFHGLTRLQQLDLSYNRLRVLSNHHFYGLIQLRILSLNHNQLFHLPDLHVEFIHTQDNPQSGLIFYNRPMPEEEEACFRFIDPFFEYVCRSQLADLYQRVAGGRVHGSIYRLPQSVQKTLRSFVEEESGLSLPSRSLFQFTPAFTRALKKYVSETFEELTQEQKNAVYGHIFELARQEKGAEGIDFSDPRWGEHHAEDNVLRLIDAIDAVLGIWGVARRIG